MNRESSTCRVRFLLRALHAAALPVVAATVLLGSASCSKSRQMQPRVPETTSADAPSVRATGVEGSTPGSLSTPPGPRPTYQRPLDALDSRAPAPTPAPAQLPPTPTTAGMTDDQILQCSTSRTFEAGGAWRRRGTIRGSSSSPGC